MCGAASSPHQPPIQDRPRPAVGAMRNRWTIGWRCARRRGSPESRRSQAAAGRGQDPPRSPPVPYTAAVHRRLQRHRPRTAQQLDIDRAMGIPACGLGTPDRQRVADRTGIEQLDAAQLHQFRVAVTLRPTFLSGLHLQQVARDRSARPSPAGTCMVRRAHDHPVPGLLGRDHRACAHRGNLRGTLQARPDDLDQALVPVDDVPLWLGHQARPGARARDRHQPGRLRVGAGPFLPQPRRTRHLRQPRGMGRATARLPGPGPGGSRALASAQPARSPDHPDRPVRGAARRHVSQRILQLRDVTSLALEVGTLVARGDLAMAQAMLRAERPYQLPARLPRQIGITHNDQQK